jgi:fluoride exporter
MINPDTGGNMEKIIAVVLGGGLGALLRWHFSGFVQNHTDSLFPWGTLAVNVVGCFVIGLLWNLFEYVPVAPAVRLFFITGILGGFTTFSSFGVETINLLRDNEFLQAALNIALSNIVGITMVFFGFIVSRIALQLLK